MDLTPYLDDLARRLDPAAELALEQAWQDFLAGNCPADVFCPRRTPAPPTIDYPPVHPNDALEDHDLMALQQLTACSGELERGSGQLLNIRCNYGVSTMPTFFGAGLYIMERQFSSLPNSRPIGIEGIRRLVSEDLPALTAGQMGQVWTTAARFREILAPYPQLERHIHIYHPDLQGPMDVCELLWGSDIFVDLYDEPELVHAALDRICEAYEAIMDRWNTECPSRLADGYSAHWGYMLRGRIMLRDDSAMNLSPEMFGAFIAPYNTRLLASCGGGCDHFCGRGDHYIDQLTALPGLHAINLSQPDYNDMERIYAATVDRGVAILGLPRPALAAAVEQGRSLHGWAHSFQLPTEVLAAVTA